MKVSKLFFALVMMGALAVLGCGDSNSGGQNAGEACSGPRCEANDALRATCETEFNLCVDTGVNVDECVVAAAAICGNV